jgi:cytochrome c-type biogenesis protein
MPIETGLLSAAGRSVFVGVPVAFVLGVLTSIGPCLPLRFAALSAYAHEQRRHALLIAATFIAGCTLVNGIIGLGVVSVDLIADYSTELYWTLAVLSLIAGVVVLLRRPAEHNHAHDTEAKSASTSFGGVFLQGMLYGLPFSPCCAPAVLALLGMSTYAGVVGYGGVLLAVYGFGHALPLLVAPPILDRVTALATRRDLVPYINVTTGAAMFCASAYFGLLA